MSNLNSKLKGVGVALVTPFTPSFEVDFPALEKLIDHTINGGVDFLVSMGTTGEAVTLSQTERRDVLLFTKEKINKRVPLVAGFGGNNTVDLIKRIQSFDLEGISAILSASPSYNKPTQAGILQHYKTVGAASPLPIIIYNVPSRTASNVSAEVVIELSKNTSNFIGVKEASGDFAQCMEIVEHTDDNFLKLSGDDLQTLPLLACGFDGVISVIANAFPSEFCEMVKAAKAGNLRKAQHMHYALKSLMQLIFVEGNPAGIKAALNILGISGNSVRLPLLHASVDLQKKLEQAIRHLEIAKVATQS